MMTTASQLSCLSCIHFEILQLLGCFYQFVLFTAGLPAVIESVCAVDSQWDEKGLAKASQKGFTSILRASGRASVCAVDSQWGTSQG